MGQIKFDIGKSSTEAANAEGGGGTRYAGPVPPKDTYRVTIKFMVMKKNRNKDNMITGVAEINEPESSKKSKFNGYGIFFNQNVTAQGAGYVNQFLDAISGGDAALRKAFWDKGVSVDESKEIAGGHPITKIGGKLRVPEQDGLDAVLAAKEGSYNGEDRLEVGSWLLPINEGPSDDEDDEGDDDVDVEEADESDEDDDDDADDEDDEGDDEDDADDESRREELEAMSRPDLVKLAKSLGIKTGKSKSESDYVTEILAAEDDGEDEAPF